MATQLRIYTVKPGTLDEWLKLFQEGLRPYRTQLGFTIEQAWTIPEKDQFAWIVSFPTAPAARPTPQDPSAYPGQA